MQQTKSPTERLKLKQELKDRFKEWKKQPQLQYELNKKKEQPIIDAIGRLAAEVGKVTDQNKNLITELIPVAGDYVSSRDIHIPTHHNLEIPQTQSEIAKSCLSTTPIETSFERGLFELPQTPSITDYATTYINPNITKFLNYKTDKPVFEIRPVDNKLYIGQSEISVHNNNLIINGKTYEATDGPRLC